MDTIPTSYSYMTLEYVRGYFHINIRTHQVLVAAKPIAPSDFLRTALQRTAGLALSSEKARSEFLVTPILLEARDYLQNNINIYSGIRFDVSPTEGLQGICDFIISKSPPTPIVQAPLLCMVEAKKNDIDAGLGQCAAEMLAAQRFNMAETTTDNVVYGCVTTGELWQFLSLEANILNIDPKRLYIEHLDQILGTLIKICA